MVGCPTEKMKVCKINPSQNFQIGPPLGKMETTLQIGDTLKKVCENAILNHKCKYQKTVRDQNYYTQGQQHQLQCTPLL